MEAVASADSNDPPCFFCLKGSSQYSKPKVNTALSDDNYNHNPESSSASVNQEFSFRQFARFLKLFDENNDRDWGIGRADPDRKRKLIQFANDSTTPTCEECYKLAKEFTELYHLLNTTKLRLNWCIRSLHDAMAMAKVEMENDSGMEISMVQDENEDQDLMATLRTMTMDRMKKMASPQVVLRKSRRRQLAPPATLPTKFQDSTAAAATTTGAEGHNKDNVLISENLSPVDDFNIQIKNVTTLMSQEAKTDDEENEVVTATATAPTSSSSSSSSPNESLGLECSYCHAHFQEAANSHGKSYAVQMLREHTIQYHCEHYFPNHKLNSIADPHFKKIMADLLFEGLLDGKGCAFCDEKFLPPVSSSPPNLLQIKSHLVESHFTELEQKLFRIQNDPDLPNILRRCNPSGWMCGCGVYLSNFEVQIRHEQFHCNLGSAANSNPANQEDRVLCKFCGRIVIRESMSSHFQNSCPKRLSSSSENSSTPTETYQSSSSSCLYCRFKSIGVGSSSELTKHLVRYHPEHFFLDLLVESQGLGITLTKDQFQRIIHNILFLEFLPKKNYPNPCVFCQSYFQCLNPFETKDLLRKHLMYHHKNDLKERLKIIMQDKSLPERLESFMNKGMTCQCGMYLLNWTESRKVYHEEKQCKLNPLFQTMQLSSQEQGFVSESEEFRVNFGESDENEINLDVQTPHLDRDVDVKIEMDQEEYVDSILPDVDDRDDDATFTSNESEFLDSKNSLMQDLQQSLFSSGGTVAARQPTDLLPINIITSSSSNLLQDPHPPPPKRASRSRSNFPPESKYPSSCPYCCFNSTAGKFKSMSMSNHLVQFHPEYFFQRDGLRVDVVDVGKLQKVLHDILFPEVIPKTASVSVVQSECTFCGQTFKRHTTSGWVSLKRHFLIYHKENLVDRLNDILEDPDLEEKLSSCNPNGEWCPCGMYLPNGLNYNSRHHYFRQCRLRFLKMKDSESGDGESGTTLEADVDGENDKDDVLGRADVDDLDKMIKKEMDNLETEEVSVGEEEFNNLIVKKEAPKRKLPGSVRASPM